MHANRDRRRRLATLAAAILGMVALAGCGAAASSSSPDGGAGDDWASTLERAKGDTVRFWMYGGDDKINAYIDGRVTPALARLGVTVKRVPITDTADAVKRVVAERRAGRTSSGGVDLIWINGENFATGKQAGLWLENWSTALPNARKYVDAQDPSITTDFKVPVDGQESPWWRAAFVYAYDGARVSNPPRDFDALLAWAKANPGRFTYPAPPDYTGSSFVRQVVAAKGEDAAFAYLKEIKPFLHRKGDVYPKSQAELEQLFGDGQIDFAMAYDANFINANVRKGLFPKSARPLLIGAGALQNVSFVTIPANAANPDGAKVLADALLSPALQAQKADPRVLGNPTVLDLDRLGTQRRLFEASSAGANPYVLDNLGTPVTEIAAADVAPLEQRWTDEVVR